MAQQTSGSETASDWGTALGGSIAGAVGCARVDRSQSEKVRAALELILPEITVDLVHLFSSDDPLLEKIRMPVWMMAKSRSGFSGELFFTTESVIALANFVGISDLECWQLLAKSIVHAEPDSRSGVTPLLHGRRGRPSRKS